MATNFKQELQTLIYLSLAADHQVDAKKFIELNRARIYWLYKKLGGDFKKIIHQVIHKYKLNKKETDINEAIIEKDVAVIIEDKGHIKKLNS